MDIYNKLTTEQKALMLDELVKNEEFLHGNSHFVKLLEKQNKVDIFDFESYPTEYEVFEYFYCGLELYLRLAIFISYKYKHLASKDRDVVKFTMSKKTGVPLRVRRVKGGKLVGKPITKEYLDLLTDAFEPYYLLKHMYKHCNPSKLEDEEFLEDTLEKYRDYEDVVFNKIYRKYLDMEWEYKPLWFTKKYRTRKNGEKQLMTEFYESLN